MLVFNLIIFYHVIFYYYPLEACVFSNEIQKIYIDGREGLGEAEGRETIVRICWAREKKSILNKREKAKKENKYIIQTNKYL